MGTVEPMADTEGPADTSVDNAAADVLDPDALERLADASEASFDDFLRELNDPLNTLRRIAGKEPRDVRDTLAHRRNGARVP